MLPCLIVVHSPDGSELRIDTNHILAVRPAAGVSEHVAKGTNTLIYTGGKVFGVTEGFDDAINQIEQCGRNL